MNYMIFLKASYKRYKSSFYGILFLIFTISIAICTVLSIWRNSNTYTMQEIQRLEYGDITAWISKDDNYEELVGEIELQSMVDNVGVQEIIYSNYNINGTDSDSEGQLIIYNPDKYPYKIFDNDISGYNYQISEVAVGDIYISPSMKSMFDVDIGDIVEFPIARNGVNKEFIVRGYYEDPFMGSSMIGMKGFLISNQDFDEITKNIDASGIDALAEAGAMLHIFKVEDSILSNSEFNTVLNENTSLQQSVKFIYSDSVILGFMVLLQNAFIGFLIVFVIVLIIICIIVIGYSINTTIEQEYVNIGILKAVGVKNSTFKNNQIIFYMIPIILGITMGVILTNPIIKWCAKVLITSSGILIPFNLSIGISLISLIAIIIFLLLYVMLKTNRIIKIKPLNAIKRTGNNTRNIITKDIEIKRQGLHFWLAIKQLITGKRQYFSVCIIALMLVLFTSLITRMNVWLGPNGEGMMEAFNPADHHIGVQVVGNMNIEEVESFISSYTDITDRYLLAMPSVTVNNMDYTANVITETNRFHIQQGRTIESLDEIVVTESVAKDLNITIGDEVTVSGKLNNRKFTVVGIYQCANEMGANIGMSREGFAEIGEDTADMWCNHYFIEDTSEQKNIIQAMEEIYGGNIHVHENTWPGLYSIIAAMKALTIIMYSIVIIFILVVVGLTGSKILYMEQRNLGIYKSIGYRTRDLQLMFALRFLVVATIGAIVGLLVSMVVGDSMIAALLRMTGISNFSSTLNIIQTIEPAIIVVMLYFIFSFIAASKIRKVDLSSLLIE